MSDDELKSKWEASLAKGESQSLSEIMTHLSGKKDALLLNFLRIKNSQEDNALLVACKLKNDKFMEKILAKFDSIKAAGSLAYIDEEYKSDCNPIDNKGVGALEIVCKSGYPPLIHIMVKHTGVDFTKDTGNLARCALGAKYDRPGQEQKMQAVIEARAAEQSAPAPTAASAADAEEASAGSASSGSKKSSKPRLEPDEKTIPSDMKSFIRSNESCFPQEDREQLQDYLAWCRLARGDTEEVVAAAENGIADQRNVLELYQALTLMPSQHSAENSPAHSPTTLATPFSSFGAQEGWDIPINDISDGDEDVAQYMVDRPSPPFFVTIEAELQMQNGCKIANNIVMLALAPVDRSPPGAAREVSPSSASDAGLLLSSQRDVDPESAEAASLGNVNHTD